MSEIQVQHQQDGIPPYGEKAVAKDTYRDGAEEEVPGVVTRARQSLSDVFTIVRSSYTRSAHTICAYCRRADEADRRLVRCGVRADLGWVSEQPDV
jgi:hypothetical protein